MDLTWLGLIVGVVVALAAVGAVLWASYRGLKRLGALAEASWGEVAAQLEQRAEALPELVETVRGYAAHEKQVFEQVDAARLSALAASGPVEAAQAEAQVQAALRSIAGVAEAYPQLLASQGYLDLQSRLGDSERGLQTLRRSYNGAARELNARIATFPSSLFAKGLGLEPRAFFEIEHGSSVAAPPRVEF